MIGWPAPQAGLMPPPSFQWLLTCFSAHSGSVLQVGYRVRLRLDKEAFGMRDWVKHGETIHQFLTFCPPFCPTGRPVIQVEPPRSESDDAEWLRVDVIRATPGFCPGVAAYICPIHEQMILQITGIPMGKITQVLETIKQTRSKHPKFLWEKQKRQNTCNSYGKTTKVLAHFKLSNCEN